MKQRTPRNTRKHRRMTVRLLVDYQALGGIHCDYATTLGAGGMHLQSDLPLKRGDLVKVRFRIPGGVELFELEAKVKWAHTAHPNEEERVRIPGVGLQFTDFAATAGLAGELEDYASD
jgi:Tfp pilus assembly protein PilZ